ncbi:hypothetical protein EYZ11_003964 [Aspergillus tanneri]|uniref:Phosphatidylethanolamine-binding protein n=1 Tax=Aspergillus tanneri TaxID=1220188 RepID=A0A4S3JM14_9EURO|nr:uncharacterized protein ATNIH1004_010953 [Aspergillus tanneri]KAA8642013.1 hypothetical protein ATNIH1004_010953 [Aspergillus tanneri]THC96572.1 hypothetical protein EYZ11_003964 [Aspergillus tanneri]
MSLVTHAQNLSSSLLKAGLVPGSAPLIPDDFKPLTELSVRFGERQVNLGNLFRASECKQAPSVSFTPENTWSSKTYTLLLIDPDAPTPDDPKFAYWRHWVLSGLVPGMDDGDALNVLTEYLGPGPKDEYAIGLD